MLFTGDRSRVSAGHDTSLWDWARGPCSPETLFLWSLIILWLHSTIVHHVVLTTSIIWLAGRAYPTLRFEPNYQLSTKQRHSNTEPQTAYPNLGLCFYHHIVKKQHLLLTVLKKK